VKAEKLHIIVPAAGIGLRMQHDLPKQYLCVAGKSLLQLSLEALGSAFPEAKIYVGVCAEDVYIEQVLNKLSNNLLARIQSTAGGTTRAHTVLNALLSLEGIAFADDWVMVHDAVRPCVSHADLHQLMQTITDEPAGGLLSATISDTVKRATADGYVESTIPRDKLCLASTPQVFRYEILRSSLELALRNHLSVTDEASAVEAAGFPVRLVQCSGINLKVTYPEDLAMVSRLLDSQSHSLTPSIRVGQGYDVHRFADESLSSSPEKAFITLGGILIPHAFKLLAHSDGDVLTHALCDALLGASALGDIGLHFPDTAAEFKGINSQELLGKVAELVLSAGYILLNADITVVAQAPKIAPHAMAIQTKLASTLQVDPSLISIKATTTEGLGSIGRGEGIACTAVVLIQHVT
jgi:2-C-methyl-D-erythritol 4-phosphate cytidylyltransferase/2-C-methyl-D-erythritol 2,4-cyclodiphosphate synthase